MCGSIVIHSSTSGIALTLVQVYVTLYHITWCFFFVNVSLFFHCQVDVGLPFPQRVVKLPEISWDQYTTSLGNFEREFRNRKRNSRRAKLIFDKGKYKIITCFYRRKAL